MKNEIGWILIVFLIGFLAGAAFWVPITSRLMEKKIERETEDVQIYPTGSFKLTFSVNEDNVDLEGKEALTTLMEQFVMDLAEAVSYYRYDGQIEHIKLLGARLAGDKEEEARLKLWMEGEFIPRLSDKD